ncbi:MAG TPA: GNAT family N-acetyltransferase [Ktedonobacteraceae bacterium]|jgi:ribosomal-protein-alanine N-acetyltransferase|nr:GNAT family N-acetyltransferase [Ktedonobacteraceae bacterium]
MHDPAQSPIFPVLETRRLLLREMQLEDIRSLFAVLSDLEVVRFYDTPFTQLEQVERAIERHHFRFLHGDGLRWGITLKDEQKVIGNCGYAWDKDNHFAVLSYVLGRPYWGQGIMTEALGAIIHYGFEQYQLHRIEADVALPNIGSMRVLQKLGFREEGLRKERFFAEGRYYDEKLFALLHTSP